MLFKNPKLLIISSIIAVVLPELALACGNTSDGFKKWLSNAHTDAINKGIDQEILNKIFPTISYNLATINADRNQSSLKLSFDDFLQKRGVNNIVNKGKVLKKKYANLFKSIKEIYGVPAGPLLAIWGMETAFGTSIGKQHTLSALATLAYDCRRSAFFTEQFNIALELIAEGKMDPNSRGALHGEIGQFQFLPSNLKKFGVDGNNDNVVDIINSKADAFASTANFFKKNGWQPGVGYQPDEPNFKAIKSWNASTVYQKAIAYAAAKIDEIKLKKVY
ncbi:Membrane-bound lytic murein transglycosylase B precursor [Liberibacter crescens BT-1]|uniref:Membrane-bound lytic murein transglycosylase B n=1 Tax=Liberibacter crescens (strain BT-1) TaxID=1215343 RepID=L0EXE8_LIBCB|nr:lytic murein transglycosylase [Liberibacter crescens]AGA65041.1 Membrane-bound lytic murein transglycosylase B precursor [Liberibacter crescens BT-1]AMC13041.1 lytic transglycosylase [Liberibacter crescens]